MPKIRGNPASKWTRRAGVATEDYKEGIANPAVPWEQATVASAPVQAAAVQAAIQRGAFESGVKAAGNAKWQRKAEGIGASRYAQGVAAAEDDYAKNVAPYLDAIEGVKMPPRGAKGDPNNINRVIAINKVLRDKKLELQRKK